jgi:YHS domain-containing protein
MVDNKKDPNCGMPVTAGIMDTVHYKGKVYGFCSDECRDAFLKNPVAMVKAAELK